MSKILQNFINNHLISLRNDDDFQKLKDAATNLSKSEFRKKDNLVKYVLTAFDPNINVTELALEKTKIHVEKQSPTVLSQSKDTPRTILRAVILEALYTRALNDIDYARIIWYTGSNVFDYYSLGNEKDILHDFLLEVGEKVEKEAIQEWSLVNKIPIDEIGEFNLKIEAIKGIQAEMATFQKEFHNAFQHTAWGGENPYNHPQHNANWGNHFTKNGGESITKLMKNIIQKYSGNLETISTQINEFMGNLKPYFEKIGSQTVQGVMAVNNRSQLLWWKESLYSPSAKKGYRELPRELVPLVMAFDLYSIVTNVYPVSIDYILKETIRKVLLANANSISFKNFIEFINKNENTEYIKSLNIKISYSEGRISLINYIVALANDDINNVSKFQEQLGIDPKQELNIDELAVWLFHDFQSYKIMIN